MVEVFLYILYIVNKKLEVLDSNKSFKSFALQSTACRFPGDWKQKLLFSCVL